jgi:hypothetical protein
MMTNAIDSSYPAVLAAPGLVIWNGRAGANVHYARLVPSNLN